MVAENSNQPNFWGEDDSAVFVDYGRYFVPDRQAQIETIAALIPQHSGPYRVLDLACGEGLLSQALLERYPDCRVVGMDGSLEMLVRAASRLAGFGPRFQASQFDLFDRSWRVAQPPVQAIVSSLAIHHLDSSQKQVLFQDIYGMLSPGGVFILADLVQPANRLGWELAADSWDEAVRQRSMQLDGNLEGFDRFENQRWNLYRYFDPQDIDRPSRLLDQLKWLETAGFADVDVYWMRAGHAIFGGFKPESG
jgi:tRNA (cmo5U34)-methyltransferase